ncbi:MAG: hypothetical protein OHK0022_46480 [Roseiflexaceae bacterium]
MRETDAIIIAAIIGVVGTLASVWLNHYLQQRGSQGPNPTQPISSNSPSVSSPQAQQTAVATMSFSTVVAQVANWLTAPNMRPTSQRPWNLMAALALSIAIGVVAMYVRSMPVFTRYPAGLDAIFVAVVCLVSLRPRIAFFIVPIIAWIRFGVPMFVIIQILRGLVVIGVISIKNISSLSFKNISGLLLLSTVLDLICGYFTGFWDYLSILIGLSIFYYSIAVSTTWVLGRVLRRW